MKFCFSNFLFCWVTLVIYKRTGVKGKVDGKVEKRREISFKEILIIDISNIN